MLKFCLPTRIFFGSGTVSLLKQIIEERFEASRLLLITDQGIVKSGIADRVISQFPGIHLFEDVEQNPKQTTINKAGEWVRRLKPRVIIGLGGGSSMDAAKAAALLATNPGKIEDYEGKGRYKSPPLPVIAIPTTCGTGSEVTWVSVITHTERKFKMSIKGPDLFPEVAVVDPDLLISLPSDLIASTGMDALTHAIEAYTVKAATSLTDIFARKALELIFSSVEKAYKDVEAEKEAREKMMLGSTLAGISFGNSGVGSVHCLSEAVGSLYDTPHGAANSIFLPFVMEVNLPLVEDRYADIARLAGIEEDDNAAAAQKLIEKVKSLSQSMNIPSLRDLGIRETEFAAIAEKAYQNNSNLSNPREAGVEDYVAILKKMIHDY